MRSASGKNNALDRLLAYATGLPCTAIHAVLKLEKSFDSIGIHIIRDRGSAEFNGLIENFSQSQAQTFQLNSRESSGDFTRTDAGAKKTFVGIDIPYTMQQCLIEKRRLDADLARTEEMGKIFG